MPVSTEVFLSDVGRLKSDLVSKCRLQPTFASAFIPGRYPYTYAYDFVRSYPNVVPDSHPKQQWLALLGTESRAETSVLIRCWAQLSGLNHRMLLIALADAYCEIERIAVSAEVKLAEVDKALEGQG